jgi:hypothetical protein
MNDVAELESEAVWAALRHISARQGLRISRVDSDDGGFRAVLEPEEGDELFFAQMSTTGRYVSLSLVLVVDEGFFAMNTAAILAVTSGYEVSSRVERDERLKEDEVYLSLSLRLFLPGLNEEVFNLAAENLRAAREALAAAFPW